MYNQNNGSVQSDVSVKSTIRRATLRHVKSTAKALWLASREYTEHIEWLGIQKHQGCFSLRRPVCGALAGKSWVKIQCLV